VVVVVCGGDGGVWWCGRCVRCVGAARLEVKSCAQHHSPPLPEVRRFRRATTARLHGCCAIPRGSAGPAGRRAVLPPLVKQPTVSGVGSADVGGGPEPAPMWITTCTLGPREDACAIALDSHHRGHCQRRGAMPCRMCRLHAQLFRKTPACSLKNDTESGQRVGVSVRSCGGGFN
jgi:hypothetical protein